jgi:ribosomal protein S20
LNAAVAAGDQKQIAIEFATLSSHLDKAAGRKIVHKNLANRKKSRAAKSFVLAKTPKA